MIKYLINIICLVSLFVFSFRYEIKAQQYFSEYNYKISENEPLHSHPAANLEIVLPVLDNKNTYEIIVENAVGRTVYEKYYKKKFSNYGEFLIQLQSKKTFINSHYLDESDLFMKIDTADYIHSEYLKYGIEYIIDKYLEKSQPVKYWKTRYVIKSTFPLSIAKSIIKFMYYNEYYIVMDDISGHYIFMKDKVKDTN